MLEFIQKQNNFVEIYTYVGRTQLSDFSISP